MVLFACAWGGLLSSVLGGCGDSPTVERVTLQLNWLHGAEFVGYYVAETEGFYDEQGLGVTIVEGGPGTPARDRLLNGEVDFAVTSFAEQRDLVRAGKPVVAVTAAFQIPPLVVFSLADSGIEQPADLVGKRVGCTTEYWKTILEQTLAAAGVDPASVTEVDVTIDQMGLLYSGEVDAWLGYAHDEPIKAVMDGHRVNNIYSADFGVGGYEGLLITQEGTASERPELVERFVAASYKGWRYALEHYDEAAQVLTTWVPRSTLEFQRLAVRAVIPLVDSPQVPTGWIDEARWRQLLGADYVEDHPGYTMQFSPVTP